MDLGSENLDLSKLINVKGNVDNITPHKIAVVAFIREYGLLKIEAKDMIDCTMAPKYRKDFCILALKLIQCPDMEFKDLETLLTNGRYNLLSVHLENFCVRLKNIHVNGISALMDCVTSTVDKLMIEQNETNPCVITRCSVLGFYLRRIMLHLDKLTFVQVVSLYKSFCLYYQKGRPGLMMRSLSKEKLNNMEPPGAATSSVSPVFIEGSKPPEVFMKMNMIERDNSLEECQWSRKQAELFTAQQANLLQINEKKALPPRQLQKTIMQIINDIPDYSDIHFLSFLNCIRMKEFCGAQDSLYNCFDRTVFNICGNANNCNDKNKNFRYAALNRAAMHTQFGHLSVAMEGVQEALGAAQEAADAACLAHAAAWGALAGGRARRAALLARVPRAPRVAAAAAQLMAQHAAVNAAKPAEVFQIITKGDSINYLHSMTDLTMAGLANTAALWSLYGKTEMASISCQLLLNLNTKCNVGSSSVWHWSEACAVAGAGAACVAAWRGEGARATALLSHLHHLPPPPLRAVAARHHAGAALLAGTCRMSFTTPRWSRVSVACPAPRRAARGYLSHVLHCAALLAGTCHMSCTAPCCSRVRVACPSLRRAARGYVSHVLHRSALLAGTTSSGHGRWWVARLALRRAARGYLSHILHRAALAALAAGTCCVSCTAPRWSRVPVACPALRRAARGYLSHVLHRPAPLAGTCRISFTTPRYPRVLIACPALHRPARGYLSHGLHRAALVAGTCCVSCTAPRCSRVPVACPALRRAARGYLLHVLHCAVLLAGTCCVSCTAPRCSRVPVACPALRRAARRYVSDVLHCAALLAGTCRISCTVPRCSRVPVACPTPRRLRIDRPVRVHIAIQLAGAAVLAVIE
ncbi:unnamed protein product [Parnassius apollo]|uniref:Anaphase-promoting complex subunit 5 n=1 Tax=Parnassius apollo TaxID=110799 RepID=A0A8S3XF12_PARAO|nr:unnamed protein product [Parnassius apollo]